MLRVLLTVLAAFFLAGKANALEPGDTQHLLCGTSTSQKVLDGSWMEGGWGIRVVIPAGRYPARVNRFASRKLIDQLAGIKSARWVMLNLTAPSFGGMFTAPDEILLDRVSRKMAPSKDLLGYYIDQLRNDGYRIILYVASQGPSLDFLKRKRIQRMKRSQSAYFKDLVDINKAWKLYLERNGLSNEEAFASVIERYSRRYGKKIDGWWFDHGVHGNPEMYINAAKSGNPQALVAWIGRHKIFKEYRGAPPIWLLTRATPLADYTDGHVSRTRKNGKGNVPWWTGNEWLIWQVESCDRISGAIPHVFSPLQSTWRSGKEVFPDWKAVDWTLRVVEAGGGITWAAALARPEYSKPEIDERVYRVIKAIDSGVLKRTGPRVNRR